MPHSNSFPYCSFGYYLCSLLNALNLSICAIVFCPVEITTYKQIVLIIAFLVLFRSALGSKLISSTVCFFGENATCRRGQRTSNFSLLLMTIQKLSFHLKYSHCATPCTAPISRPVVCAPQHVTPHWPYSHPCEFRW